MHKTNYLITIPGGLSVVYLLVVLAWRQGWNLPLLLAAAAVFGIALAMIFILTYQMWQAIQDGHARMTPRQAVLYNFIPGFNFYWLFQCIWGFAKDGNAYIQRHHLSIPLLSERMFFAYVALWFLSPLPYVGLVTVPICIVLVTKIVGSSIDLITAARQVR